MDVGTRAAEAGGRALGVLFAAVSRIRPADKPMHPRGLVARGVLVRFGVDGPTGVGWLDGTGTDEVFVRVSRGAGLPRALPDVPGLAVRVHLADGSLADLLFSATGSGPYSRYVFRPAFDVSSGRLTTLMPYRTPQGARLLAVDARVEDGRLTAELSTAAPRGPWLPFAELRTEPLEPEAERTTSFDAFLNTVPGLEPYDWIRRLRERSYAAARGSRDARVPQRADDPDALP